MSNDRTMTANNEEQTANIIDPQQTKEQEEASVEKYVKPSLPPLYFHNVIDSTSLSKSSPLQSLPSEMTTNILSYLDWGDHARLASVHSSFQSILFDAAQYGGHDSKWTLATSLLKGNNGLSKNPVVAIQYLEDLSGVVSRDGDGNKQVEEEVQAIEKMEKEQEEEVSHSMEVKNDSAKDEKYTPAMCKLATCHLTGSGVPINPTIGLQWLKIAHHHSDNDAAYEMATIYEYSKHGVPVDIVLAASWFHKAAIAGHVDAMAEYAMCCELGCGVEQSDEKALDWYTKAAEKGHATSNFSVGEMFEQARGGLPQSDSEAVLWYYKAAMMGDEDSLSALKRLNDIARIIVPGWARTLNV